MYVDTSIIPRSSLPSSAPHTPLTTRVHTNIKHHIINAIPKSTKKTHDSRSSSRLRPNNQHPSTSTPKKPTSSRPNLPPLHLHQHPHHILPFHLNLPPSPHINDSSLSIHPRSYTPTFRRRTCGRRMRSRRFSQWRERVAVGAGNIVVLGVGDCVGLGVCGWRVEGMCGWTVGTCRWRVGWE